MLNVSQMYADYAVEVREDAGTVLIEEVAPDQWARFHYRIFRVPSQKLFTLRHCEDATPDERERAERVLESMPAGGWATTAPWFRRKHSTEDYFFFKVFLGRLIENPLLQLELEMMIDLAQDTASLGAKGRAQ